MNQLTIFDYNSLDVETRDFIQQRTSEIKALMKRTAQDIIEIGQRLIDVKARLGHGRFGDWLQLEFDWHWNTAHNFMRVADKFTNFVNIEHIAPSALYLLAAPSTPEEARQEAINRAEQGETITLATAKEIVTEHKSAQDIVQLIETPEQALELERALREQFPEIESTIRKETMETHIQQKEEAKQARREELMAMTPPDIPPMVVIDHRDNTAHVADESVELILTDPPYNISGSAGVTKVGNQLVSNNFDGDDTWDTDTDETFLIKLDGWVREWARIIRPGGAVVSFMDRAKISLLWDLCKKYGLDPKNIIVWRKSNPSPASLARENLISAAEFMIWATKGNNYTFNEAKQTGWNRHNVIEVPIIGGHEKVDHPTQKPLKVLLPLVEVFSNPGDLILDPFAGSGSTGVAALQLDRQAYLIEKNPFFIRLAQERLAGLNNANERIAA